MRQRISMLSSLQFVCTMLDPTAPDSSILELCNLNLCHTYKAVSEATEPLSILDSVYCFFSISLVNCQTFTDIQKVLGLVESELVQLSKTQWACQVRSVNAVIVNLTAVLRCLEEIAGREGCCQNSSVYMLMMLRSLHKYLQKKDVDVARAKATLQRCCH